MSHPDATPSAQGNTFGEERRRTERVVVNDEFSQVPKTPHVRDLSTGGVFLQTLERLPIGREVMLRFTVVLDEPVIVEAKARIVRHQRQPSGMGIELTDLTPEALLRLSDAVARSRPIPLHASARPSGEDMGRAPASTNPLARRMVSSLDADGLDLGPRAPGSRHVDDEPDLDARTVLMARPDSGQLTRVASVELQDRSSLEEAHR